MDRKASQPLDHPWLSEKKHSPKVISPLPEAAEEASLEQDVFGLAANLKTAIRDERIRQSSDAKKT